ncbi:DUF4926 domain-containing protein [Synechocystis sp. PCC 6714]|uniref:DUF4926 domain-containing protein n=1 Tax=unclassified Synechocystis TaxID=2640012 RepID=UPI0026D3915F
MAQKLRDYHLLTVVVTGGKKMTGYPIKLLDIVALTADLPDYKLWRGQVGTVVEFWPMVRP